MTKFASVFLGAVWIAFGALAQGAIETGEHGEFTRVVIPIGADGDYRLEENGETRRLTVSPSRNLVATSAMAPLSDGRVLGIGVEDSDVVIRLGCACTVEPYRYLDRFLILDFYDGPPLSQPAFAPTPRPRDPEAPDASTEFALPLDAPTVERALANQRPYRPAQQFAQDLLQVTLSPVPRLAALDRPRGTDFTTTEPETGGDRRAQAANAASDPMAPDQYVPLLLSDGMEGILNNEAPEGLAPSVAETANLEEIPSEQPGVGPPPQTSGLIDTADALAEQLARAAAAGLLETSAQQPLSAADQPIAPRDEPDQEPDAMEGDPAPTGLPVRAANAFDIAGSRDSGLAAVAAALSCAQPIGDMQSWSTGLGFEQELGALRQAAFGADGELRRAPTIALARYYIFHGFGAEAEAWLQQLEEPPATELAMARYLDDHPGPNFPEVETLALCSGLDMLWRFVDAPEFPELALSQRQEMRLAFSGLPLGLRRLLGPDFVRKLVAAGYEDDAEDVREALSRGPTLDDAETLVLQMETTDDRPSRRETEALEDQLETAGPDASRVMREYLAARRQAGDPPEDDRLIAAEALLREIDRDLGANSLWHEVLLAHTLRGDMDRAFPMLDLLQEQQADDKQVIQSSVVEVLLRHQNDAALIVMSARLAGQAGGHGLSNRLAVSVHDRLSDIGLVDLAEAIYSEANRPDAPPPAPPQNWAAAAGTDEPGGRVARRIANLESTDASVDPGNPDQVRATLEDSRALREDLAELLGGVATN